MCEIEAPDRLCKLSEEPCQSLIDKDGAIIEVGNRKHADSRERATHKNRQGTIPKQTDYAKFTVTVTENGDNGMTRTPKKSANFPKSAQAFMKCTTSPTAAILCKEQQAPEGFYLRTRTPIILRSLEHGKTHHRRKMKRAKDLSTPRRSAL